jgi:hypothetical protein
MEPIDMPPPFGGVNQVVPVVAIQPPFCQQLLNFNVNANGVTLRNGDSIYKKIAKTNAGYPLRIIPYDDTKLFLITFNSTTAKCDFIDVDTATLITSTAFLGPSSWYPLYFNKYLFFFPFLAGYAPGLVWDGAALGAVGYTGTGTFSPLGGAIFNERAYLIQKGEAAYWYSPISAISGACTKVDLSTVVTEKSNLIIIAPLTLSETQGTTTYLAFIFSNGEVLYYKGSYPDSADWERVGRTRIGQPLDYNCSLQYQGDSLVFCDSGVISLRDLFLKGSEEAASLTVNARIQASWTGLISKIRLYFNVPTGPISAGIPTLGIVSAVWDPISDRIIINFPYFLDAGQVSFTGNYKFVFYNQLQSWFFHQSIDQTAVPRFDVDICRYKNSVKLLSSGDTNFSVFTKEGASNFTDRGQDDSTDNPYSYEIISAPVTNDKNYASYSPQVVSFARNQSKLVGYTQQLLGMDVILETDLGAQTQYTFIKDLGVTATLAQTVPSIAGLQKIFVNGGIDGTYIQYRIKGTTTTSKTVGYTLYGTNVWVQQGTSPR